MQSLHWMCPDVANEVGALVSEGLDGFTAVHHHKPDGRVPTPCHNYDGYI